MIGLLGACLAMAVEPRGLRRINPPPVGDAVTVIDVAYGVAPATIASLVRLSPGERIVEVDDRPVANELAAGVLLGERAVSRRFIDLSIGGDGPARRVLVLLPGRY